MRCGLVGNRLERLGTPPQKGRNPTSCPARRKINIFPGRTDKTLSDDHGVGHPPISSSLLKVAPL